MVFLSSYSCLCPIHWSQVLSQEWRFSWSSADRRCSNYIWVINNFIAYKGASYITCLMIRFHWWLFQGPGPCITNVIATCRKSFSQWESSFLWKLRCHWLKFLRRVAKTLVILGPGDNNSTLVYVMAWCRTGNRPLPEPMMTKFTDAYMHHQASMDQLSLILWSIGGAQVCEDWFR